MKKTANQHHIILIAAVLTAMISISVLMINSNEMNSVFSTVFYLAATFSLGTIGMLSIFRPVAKLQPVRVKR